jgi:hypothetical protein
MDEMKIARRIQQNLRRIGVASAIEVRDNAIVVSGLQKDGKPFSIRLRQPSIAELHAFFATPLN